MNLESHLGITGMVKMENLSSSIMLYSDLLAGDFLFFRQSNGEMSFYIVVESTKGIQKYFFGDGYLHEMKFIKDTNLYTHVIRNSISINDTYSSLMNILQKIMNALDMRDVSNENSEYR